MIEIFAIHTAVLVGLIVSWAWKESYGGVFAGFAVPGYLAAIALVAPSAATTILIEAVLTYGITRALGDWLPRIGLTARVFGRERFLLFVLTSVPVRLVVEGLAAGGLSELLGGVVPGGEQLGFFGVGLVLVPLTANTFWKLGLLRGVGQVVGTTGVTALLMWALVMPLLSLDLSSFLLTLENISADFLAAPKVTVLLLTTAVVSTWTAERFGWNAGGLLVPSLLALLVFGPIKLVTTFVEIILLMAVYSVATSLPGLRKLALVGPRRLVAMYVLAWILKVSLAWTGLQLELPVAAWDLYGFGYLLSSLVAVRCLDMRPPGRVLVPMGVNLGVGAALGLGASLLLGWAIPPTPPIPPAWEQQIAARGLVADVVAAAGAVVDRQAGPQDRSGIRDFRRFVVGTDGGLPIERSDGSACRAFRPRTTRGARVWWCGGNGPFLTVASPRSDPDSVWIAAWFVDAGYASGLLLGAVDATGSSDGGVGDLESLVPGLPDHDVLLVRSQPGGVSTLEPRGALAGAVRVPGVDEPIPLDFDGDVGSLARVWEALRERDGLLTVSVAEQEAGLPELVALDEVPSLDRRTRPKAHPGTSWLLHLAMSRADPASAPAVGWAAASVGLRAGVRDGLLWLADDQVEGFGAWAVRPGAKGAWLVAVPRAPEEAGTAEAALGLAASLDARAVWVATTGTRGFDPLPGRPVERIDAFTEGFRESMRATSGRDAAGVVVVRRIAETVPAPRPVVLGQAASSLIPVDGSRAAELRAAVGGIWPGAERLSPTQVGPPSLASTQPLRYAGAFDDNRAYTLWLRRDVLAGARDNVDHAAALRWYGLRGVPTLDADQVVERFGVQLDEVAEEAGILDAIAEHLEARTTRSLEFLRLAGEPVLVRTPLRMGMGIVTGDRVCLRMAGAPSDAGFPHAGCWRRR